MKLPKLTRDQVIPFLCLFFPILIFTLFIGYTGVNVPNWVMMVLHGPMFGVGFVMLLPLGYVSSSMGLEIPYNAYLWLLVFGAYVVTPIFWSLALYYPYRRFIYLKWKQ